MFSALPPKADINSRGLEVRFVPKNGHAGLFDHLVGAAQQRDWSGDPECVLGPEVE